MVMRETSWKFMYYPDGITETYPVSEKKEEGGIVPNNEVEEAILTECLEFAAFLIKKNRAYGNSALRPCRIMSKANTIEQLYVRIDDKLNRLMNGSDYPGDNDIQDLIGYLLLLQVAKKGHGN